MAVARIRTSDPEVVEFLSRHLASSGYQLEFVRPGEPVQGDAELEIDASRMDLESAMAAARQERGLITVLSGVLKADTKRDIFEEAVQTSPHEYAEVSPYARGAELQDEPSAMHKAADSVAKALAIGMNSVGEATRTVGSRFKAWQAERAEAERVRREQRERELAIEEAQRRKEEARRAEERARQRVEDERRRAEEERVAAIRREELAKAQAEELRRREEQERIEAELARERAEEAQRLQAEAQQRRAEEEEQRRALEARRRAEEERAREEQARIRAEEEDRRRAQELAATGIERQRQEELRLAEESRRREEEERVQQQAVEDRDEEERRWASAAAEHSALEETETATFEDALAQPETESEWQPVEAPDPVWETVAATPSVAEPERRYRPRRRLSGNRERVFKRAGVAAAIVAAGVVTLWSLTAIRRPANPLNQEQLVRSAVVEQQRPFGPAQTVAPISRQAIPAQRPAAPARRPAAKKPTPRPRASRARSTRVQTANKSASEDDGNDVVVRHFTTKKQEQAKVKTKNGVKIISESD